MQALQIDLFGNAIQVGKKTTAELIRESIADIKHEYEHGEPGAWALKCSFGKDSGVMLNNTVNALLDLPPEQRTRHIYVICADTGVETPLVFEHVHSQADQVNALIRKHNLPMSVHIVKRDPEDSYFVETLGRGYPLTNQGERRCTDDLKIKPAEKFLKEIDYSVTVTGVRRSESDARLNTYGSVSDRRMRDEKNGKLLFMPIIDMTVEDIWEALAAPLAWGSSLPYRTLYAEATGECGFQNPRGTVKNKVDACGARFGCWVCPVVSQDKSTQRMAVHHPWMEPYVLWRDLQMKVYGRYVPERTPQMTGREWKRERERWELFNARMKNVTKAGYMRDHTELKDGQGCLLIEARRYLLDKLLEAQDTINQLRADEDLPPTELISQEEIDIILEQHEEDLHERPWLTKNTPDIEAAMNAAMEQVERELEIPFDPTSDNLFTVGAKPGERRGERW